MAAINTVDRDFVKALRPHIYALPMSEGWKAFDASNGHSLVAGPFSEFEDVWCAVRTHITKGHITETRRCSLPPK